MAADGANPDRRNLSTVCHHLALVAIDGATDEVALTLDPTFVLYLDGASTDRWGYLALVEANRALSPTRPPLDVRNAASQGDFVTVGLEPRCLAHFRVVEDLILRLWMTADWNVWTQWLRRYDMS